MKSLRFLINNSICTIIIFLFIPEVKAQGVFEYYVTPRKSLDFGTFTVKPNITGTVSVDADGVVGNSASVIFMPLGDTRSPGEFEITGTKGKATVTFSEPESPSELIGTTTGVILNVDNLTFNPKSVYVDKFIYPIIKIGGTLTIPPNAPEDTYSGTIFVIFNYN